MPIVWTQDPAANELLETDPLALLIGMVLDQQVKMEKAFAGPYELKRRSPRTTAPTRARCGETRGTATTWQRASRGFPGLAT
jgi:hypothetical protein